MKQLFNEWRQYLSEDTHSPKAKLERLAQSFLHTYLENDDTPEYEDLLKVKDRGHYQNFSIKLIEEIKEEFDRLGGGAFRTAFDLGDGRVAKIATETDGITDNGDEIDLSHNSKFSDIIIDVEEAWPSKKRPIYIVTEKVSPFKRRDWGSMMKHFGGFKNNWEKIENFGRYMPADIWKEYLYTSLFVRAEADVEKYLKQESIINSGDIEYWMELYKEITQDSGKELQQLKEFVLRKPSWIGDLEPRNAGVDDEGHFVLIDPSIISPDEGRTFGAPPLKRKKIPAFLHEFEEKRYGEKYANFKNESQDLFGKLYDAAKQGLFDESTFKARYREKLKAMADKKFGPPAGKGANRIAFSVGGKSILKIALNDEGVKNNEEEIDLTSSAQFADILLQVEDYGPVEEYPAWIITEKLEVMEQCSDIIQSFPVLSRNEKEVIEIVDGKLSSLCRFFQIYLLVGLVNYAKDFKDKEEFGAKVSQVISKFPAGDMRQKARKIAEFFRKTYPDASDNLKDMIRFIARYPANITEYGPRNMGKDSKGNTVLLDPSVDGYGTQLGVGRYLKNE